ncbi:MAG TPA: hypothetical protein VMA75_01340 [Candidatus Paceibacterota bacterium]|nr:hypothetical protein [Candidatus Paceibacterota bacterium]
MNIARASVIDIQYGCGGRVAVEPNTKPPNLTGEDSVRYCREIEALLERYPREKRFTPVPIMQITEHTTPQMALDAYALGVRIFKVYPFFVTTNSENGVKDYTKLYRVFETLEKLPGVVVQFHAETPRFEVFGRIKEERFFTGEGAEMPEIERRFQGLAISIEHVSSKVGIEWIRQFPLERRIRGSITIQHITNTADDMSGYSWRSGGLMRVHEGFKPQAKDPDDRDAVRAAALSGDPRFFNSNDDAWHLKSSKECAGANCGAANTIAAPSLTIEFFEENHALDKLEPFVSEFGPRFYGYSPNTGTTRYVKKPSRVPAELEVPGSGDTVIPWRAGEELQWQVADD